MKENNNNLDFFNTMKSLAQHYKKNNQLKESDLILEPSDLRFL